MTLSLWFLCVRQAFYLGSMTIQIGLSSCTNMKINTVITDVFWVQCWHKTTSYALIFTFPFVMLIFRLTLLILNQNKEFWIRYFNILHILPIYVGRHLSSVSLHACALEFEELKALLIMYLFSGLINKNIGKLYSSFALDLELNEKDNHQNRTINNVNSYI